MIHSSQPARDFVDYAVRYVLLRQGVLGIKVKVYVRLVSLQTAIRLIYQSSMKGYNPEGQLGPRKPLPDSVTIVEPPVDKVIAEPTSERRGPAIPQAAYTR
ncbi:40S ribosomal protein S3 [Lactarius deliciosus]|nr:40S ribosomal protein S3 [Lactarius deliciosus]